MVVVHLLTIVTVQRICGRRWNDGFCFSHRRRRFRWRWTAFYTAYIAMVATSILSQLIHQHILQHIQTIVNNCRPHTGKVKQSVSPIRVSLYFLNRLNSCIGTADVINDANFGDDRLRHLGWQKSNIGLFHRLLTVVLKTFSH